MAISRTGSRKHHIDVPELMLMELRQIHSAESQLSRALPRMTKTVESEELRQCLERRLEQAEDLIADLDEIFEEMEESPGRQRNAAAEGLIDDAREHLRKITPGPAHDAIAIAALQKAEHYCIAAWGTAKAMAEALKEQHIVECMDRVLEEGNDLDEELSEIAEDELIPSLRVIGEEEDDEAGTDETTARRGNGALGHRRSRTRHH